MEDTKIVEIKIFGVLLPGFDIAYGETKDGYRYAITRHTQGVNLQDVREGQSYICNVTTKFPRILNARLI